MQLKSIFNHQSSLRHKIIGILGLLIVYNLSVWLWAWYSFSGYPLLFSTAVLAYTFGLRHAVDADHIAAIDNVTRKFLQEGKPAVSVGLFFSLGHSTVVIIASVIIALTTTTFMQRDFTRWHEIASMVCTCISAFFLLLIATINLLIFVSIYQTFQQIRKGQNYQEEDINQLMNHNGFLAKRFRRIFQVIAHSWQMYPLGFLFGIGFDTATEIALLGITASQTLNGLPLWSILIFPALFTAGMTLVDTIDGILMIGAYGWAFMKPIRKLYYNLTITFASIVIALFVGSVEILGLIAKKIEAEGPVWEIIKTLNEHYNHLGYIIIFIFMASWLISVIVYKWMQFDELERSH
jgi:high-affinity nickel-transport protein